MRPGGWKRCLDLDAENVTAGVLRSPEWRAIPEDERRAMELTFNDDGEFW